MANDQLQQEATDCRSTWESRDRECYRAQELRDDYRQALYSERGREIVDDHSQDPR